MATIPGFLREVAAAVGDGPFTAPSLAMRHVFVPKGTTLRQLHAAGLLVSDGTAWRLAPGVTDRIRTKGQVAAQGDPSCPHT